MIVVRLMGGLGNQMFQYAFGRRFSLESKSEVRLDTVNGFRQDRYGRRLKLDALNTSLAPAIRGDIPLGMSWVSPFHRLAKAFWTSMPRSNRRVIYERQPFSHDESLTSGGVRSGYYFGYWQHEGYFLPIREHLKREFCLRAPVSEGVAALRKEMAACRAVSVHVRCYHDLDRAGKVIQRSREVHGVCPVSYYQEAVARIGGDSGTVCYIFSDNPAWVKANLKLSLRSRHVAELCKCSDVEEMQLMASCKHHVISNSSFSWWGAWLGNNPEKIVVAPSMWKRGLPEEAVDLCPREWLRLRPGF